MTTLNDRGHRPKKGTEPSQTPRAVKARADRATKALEPQNAPTVPSGGGVPVDGATSEPIGIVDSNPPVVDPVDKPPDPNSQTYHCTNCKGIIVTSDTKCPVCELELAWPTELKS